MTLTNSSFQALTQIVKLENTQLLFIKGPDAPKFLQGQVTCDIRELSNSVTRIGAQCNAKGRILLSFRALQMDEEIIALRIPKLMLEHAYKSLGKYIVFSKAKLHSNNEYQLFGLFGKDAQSIVSNFFNKLPVENEGWIETDGNYVIQLDENRFECWVSSKNTQSFQEQIEDQAKPSELKSWDLLNIQSGIADVHPETIEIFTPQEINYQLVNGINFRKGCYTGQEIVPRIHYRGKLKRQMYRFRLKTSQLPLLGSALISTDTQQNVGHIVNAVYINNDEVELLASLLEEQVNNVMLASGSENLKQQPLPYAIPTADEKTE
jgi:tRNA-modifying protein YgfZ